MIVAGDVSIAGLGLSLTDRQTLVSNVNIMFHAAATIKFDESLKLAVDINVHGTKDVLELAKETTNLKVSEADEKPSTRSTNGLLSHSLFCSLSFTCQQLTPTAT